MKSSTVKFDGATCLPPCPTLESYIRESKCMRSIQRKSVRILWVEGYYDGPLDGFCSYRDGIFYFAAQDEDWTCFMHPLKEETWFAHLAKEMDFENRVGTHWVDWGEDGFSCGTENMKPQSEWHKFYDKYANSKLPSPDELPPLYWFWMYGPPTKRAKFLRRKERLAVLRDAKAPRCRSSTGT